jgi:hypothetical protein
MSRVIRVVVSIIAISTAPLVVSVGCSRRNGGAAAADSAAPSADSITPATAGKPGSSPSGQSARPAGPTVAKKQSAPPKSASSPTRAGAGAAPAPIASGRPHLIKLTPSSGSLASGAIITVEVAGDRFTAAGNTTFFGSITLGDLASPDGRTIRFAVPQTVPSRGEVPPMAIQPGSYRVYVVNSNGTSDTLTFTIREQHP